MVIPFAEDAVNGCMHPIMDVFSLARIVTFFHFSQWMRVLYVSIGGQNPCLALALSCAHKLLFEAGDHQRGLTLGLEALRVCSPDSPLSWFFPPGPIAQMRGLGKDMYCFPKTAKEGARLQKQARELETVHLASNLSSDFVWRVNFHGVWIPQGGW